MGPGSDPHGPKVCYKWAKNVTMIEDGSQVCIWAEELAPTKPQ